MERGTVLDRVDFSALDFDQTFNEIKERFADEPLPARSAEDGLTDEWIRGKEYSHSDRLREVVAGMLGSVALEEVVSVADLPLEVRAAIVSLRDRQKTSIIEMIQTYPELRAVFHINYERRHLVRESHIMAADGETRMDNILDRGEEKAKQDAEANPLMIPIARRTGADARFGKEANKLENDEFLIGPSAYEDSADELFMRSIGWNKGLSFFQAACPDSDNTTIMFSYSVDPVPSHVVRKVWEQVMGVKIPEGLPADTWQDYSVILKGGVEECRKKLLELREACYRETGDTRQRFTLEEIFKLNEGASKEIFNKLYMRVTLRVKDEVLQNFTKGLLDDPDALDEGVYQKLSEIYNRDHLTPEDASLLEQLVRYAEAQHYCRRLRVAAASGVLATQVVVPTFQPVDIASLHAMVRNLTSKVLQGARRNDIFGGCTKVMVLGKRKSKGNSGDQGLDDELNYLELSGIEDDELDEEVEEDEQGPLVFKCTEGHRNKRRRGERLLKCRITTCHKGSVGCGPGPNPEMVKRVLQPFALDGLAKLITESKANKSKKKEKVA